MSGGGEGSRHAEEMFSTLEPALYPQCFLTLIRELNIVLAFDPPRGALMRRDAGGGQMRRPRATKAPARSWLVAAGQARPKGSPAGSRPHHPPKARPGAIMRTFAMARRETPAFWPDIPRRRIGIEAMTPGYCVQFATLLEHLSIRAGSPLRRRDSAIPFNDIEARPRRVSPRKTPAGHPATITGAGRQGPWTPRPV